MPNVAEYLVRTDCRLADGSRHRPGATVRLSAATAKYPLLRGWIVRAPEPEPPPPEPDPPRGGRRRGA